MFFILIALLSLFGPIRSDSAISKFHPAQDNFPTYSIDISPFDTVHTAERVNGNVVNQFPDESIFTGTLESCAKVCLEAKFYCRRFALVRPFYDTRYNLLPNTRDVMNCFLLDSLRRNINPYPSDLLRPIFNSLIGVYDINKEINNVDIIMQDPSLLRNPDRNDELLAGYGILQDPPGILPDFVDRCRLAIQVSPSRETDFYDWLEDKESISPSEQVRKRRKLSHETSMSNDISPQVLAFLDLYARAGSTSSTVYDADNQRLFIAKGLEEDRHIFVASYGLNGYGVAVCDEFRYDNREKNYESCEILFSTELNGNVELQNQFVHELQQAGKRFGVDWTRSKNNIIVKDNFALSQVIDDIMGFGVPFRHIMYHDLAMVVPLLHDEEMKFKSNLQWNSNLFPKELVDIITQS